ncbi:MAG: DMT family transporter [Enterobacter sp.]|nr:DMT family transporter [Enterobacter sp.]
MTLMMIILAICGGATLSIQAAINGQLGSSVGVFKSAFLTFSVGVATVAVIFGQLAMSMLIDNFGWLGNPAISFSPSRLSAVVCLGIALYFIYSSSKTGSVRD